MRIAVIEDNRALASGIAHTLRDAGHAVDLIHDGELGDAHLRDAGADLVILDINLPGQSGLRVLRNLRRRNDNTPVLILTARADTADRVSGLDAGADDYLIKPFDMAELEARIRALLRRGTADLPATEKLGSLSFDKGARQLFLNDAPLELPRRELAAFECLFARKGTLVSKSVLADHLYGTGADVEERVIEVHISRLRKKLRDGRVSIKTARGLGYMLVGEA